MESTAEALSQTRICCFIEGPIKHKVLTESRLSRPVSVQVMQIRSEPNSKIQISEQYWLITWALGIKPKNALMTMGNKEVTEIDTGRKIHHAAIQTANPIATAPEKPKPSCSDRIVSKNNAGPNNN